MKLSGRDAAGYFARPDPGRAGLLIYGNDPMRVALRRQEVIAALIGPQGEDEMRLARIAAADLRKDPAQLLDAVKAQGFFPGQRVAFVEEATDGLAPTIAAALEEWRDGDAQIVVTAGPLAKGSKLRKLFEDHPNAYAAAIYDDPPSSEEVRGIIEGAGLRDLSGDARGALTALSRTLPPGDFRQTVEKLALYKLDDDTPVTVEDITACAPTSTEAEVDEVLDIVAEGRPAEIGPVIRRLQAQGVQPVRLCIGATGHFRRLYAVAVDPGGPAKGVAALRPPVFGPRRDRVLRQARNWPAANTEKALSLLTDTDLKLRSAGQHAPEMALVERTLIRLAMMAARARG
jgi:DNA polymerase-3 subunit delta